EMVLNRLGIFGIEVDSEANLKARFGGEGTITTANSRIPAMVISTNEELVIAEDTAKLAGL
ncbi:acetate kinase, partial [Vibrio splendidus]